MAEGGAVPPIQPKDDYVHFYYAKDHIEERLNVYDFDTTWYSPEELWFTFISVLSKDSEDYFEHHVSRLCPQLTQKAIQLEHLNQDDLRVVWGVMENLWPLRQKPSFKSSTNAYIFCKSSLGGAQETCVMAHIEILAALFTMSYHGPLVKITQLLSLSLWIFLFYTKKKEKNHKKYNSTAHVFHSDLLITFLALKCRFCPCIVKPPTVPKLPKLKPSIIHHGVSPEDPPFQRFVLEQMLLLDPNLKCGDLRQAKLEGMATFIYYYLLSDNWLWQKKGPNGILTIVKDQSRYMALRQPKFLQRNFVADKVRRELSAKAKELEQEIHRIVPVLESDIRQALTIFHAIMEEAQLKTFDDGSKLPLTSESLTLDKSDIKLLNHLHHLILVDICKELLGDKCPKVAKNGWFENIQFMGFIRHLANSVICQAKSIPKRRRTNDLYPHIAKIAVALEQIIALRCYICDVQRGSEFRIEATNELEHHLEIILIFLAFRSLLMYFLPQDPWTNYGVRRVAKELPKYAKQMRFYLPLLS